MTRPNRLFRITVRRTATPAKAKTHASASGNRSPKKVVTLA